MASFFRYKRTLKEQQVSAATCQEHQQPMLRGIASCNDANQLQACSYFLYELSAMVPAV